MTLHSQPLLTHEMARSQLSLEPTDCYVFGSSTIEARGQIGDAWTELQSSRGAKFVSVVEVGEKRVSFETDGATTDLFLNDSPGVAAYLGGIGRTIYLDITSLTHRAWAPIVLACVRNGVPVRVVYMEPADYRRSPVPSPGLIYDLSDRFGGIAPLPGFAKIPGPGSDAAVFMPLLGFEGARFSIVLESVQPQIDATYPVVGVPGFQPEFPFAAYAGNRIPLEADGLFRQVQFAKANCPFDAFHTIHRVHRAYPGRPIKLAPIGTKPHALGAVLYAIARPTETELIYDHPVRSANRTAGEARLCLYRVDEFVKSSLFLGTGEFAV